MTESNTEAALGREPSEDDIRAFLDERDVSPRSNLIGVLQTVQDRFGYLPAPALVEIGRRMKIRLSRIYGVVSFYVQFYTEPRGKHTVRVCRGTACHVRGAKRIAETVEELLDITDGETTGDGMFVLETVACLGTCFLAPVMMIDEEYFGDLTPKRVESVLTSYRENNP